MIIEQAEGEEKMTVLSRNAATLERE